MPLRAKSLPALVAALLCLSEPSFGEEAIGMAAIDTAGPDAARAAAIKDALLNAAMAGNLSVRSKSGAVNREFRDALVVGAEADLSNVHIVEQKVDAGVMKVEISFERRAKRNEPTECRQRDISLGNIVLSWARPPQAEGTPMAETRRLIVERLEGALATRMPGYLAPDNGRIVYSVRLGLDADNSSGFGGIDFEIFGPYGVRIRSGRIAFNSAIVAENARRNLGYAMLRSWDLPEETHQRLNTAVQELQQTFRCLPLVARVGFNEQGVGAIATVGRGGVELANSLAFVAWDSPFAEDGAVDLLKFDELADISVRETGAVVALPHDRKRNAPAMRTGYVVLQ